MRYKTFDQPHSHDAEWYKDREAVDHINQAGHRPRLMQVKHYLSQILSNNLELKTVCDWGCGNGGLIREIEAEIANVNIWGYDLCPANVVDAESRGSKNIIYTDFINDNNVQYSDIAICTEVLEHLVDPDAFIKKLLDNNTKYIIASSPDYETPSYHAPFHLWVFNGNSYAEMFTNVGWNVQIHHKDYFQYIVASK